MSEQKEHLTGLFADAETDPAVKERLIADPVATPQAGGVEAPEGELSPEALEAVAGGLSHYCPTVLDPRQMLPSTSNLPPGPPTPLKPLFPPGWGPPG